MAEHHAPESFVTAVDSSSDVVVRDFRDGDEELIFRLLQASFPRWPAIPVSVSPLEHLRWKLRLNESDERLHGIATIGDRAAGCILSWRRHALLRGRAITVADGSDICVHPDLRGRGVMEAILRTSREALRQPGEQGQRPALYFQRATHPAVVRRRSELSELKGLLANRVERFIRPLTFTAGLAAFRLDGARTPRKRARGALRLAGWLMARAREHLPRRRASCTVRQVAGFDERTDAFWRDAAGPFEFIMTRDRPYLSWRYADRRSGRFTILIAEEGDRLLGYIVLCAAADGRRGFVADLLVLPDRADAAAALLRDALPRFRSARVQDVECWLPERHPYRAVLEASGFVLRRRKSESAYRAAGGVPEEELAFLQEPTARIHITLGDADRV